MVGIFMVQSPADKVCPGVLPSPGTVPSVALSSCGLDASSVRDFQKTLYLLTMGSAYKWEV